MFARFASGLFAVIVVALLPAAANAATVELRSTGGGEQVLEYAGDPGEDNQAVVDYHEASQQFDIHDAGAFVLTPGNGCLSVDVEEVTCHGDDVTTMRLDGGDGNDEIDDNVPPVPSSTVRHAQIYGGPGDDRLIGSKANEEFDGGPGADYISGGRGVDSVDESQTDDLGDGVSVTLDARANDGLPGEGDNIRGVEYVVGGPGPDTLIGNNGDQHLFGRGGDDLIEGKGGDDELSGGDGTNTLIGGAGRDQIDSHNPNGTANTTGDKVDCGPGWDDATGDRQDHFGSGCELFTYDGATHYNKPTHESGRPPGLPAIVAPTVIVRHSSLLVITGCRYDAACAGSVRLATSIRPRRGAAAESRTLAQGKFHAAAGETVVVSLKMSKRARRLVKKVRRATAYVVAFGYRGGVKLTRRSVRLR